jgi:hypothetical protein
VIQQRIRAIVLAIPLCAGAPAALAEITTRAGADYSGPVTLRHVGLCSANGTGEKPDVMHLNVSPLYLEGTLTIDDDCCHIVASATASYTGPLSCRNGQSVPIHFSIGESAGVRTP